MNDVYILTPPMMAGWVGVCVCKCQMEPQLVTSDASHSDVKVTLASGVFTLV